MGKRIRIKMESAEIEAKLNDSKISSKITEKLPIESTVRTWGEEIYFEIPVKESIDNPVKEVEKKDIGYWPEGNCFCIFFGPTPVSSGEKIIPASEVEVIGKVLSDIEELKKVKSGEKVVIEEI